jgi:uncharacterized protein DUF6364
MRQKLTLSIEAELIEKIKIRAVLEKKEVSTITEELYRVYLNKAMREGKGKSKS